MFELLLRDPYWNRLMHEPFRYEPEIFHCFDLIKDEPFAFVDGGANWGFWSVLATSQQYGAVETVAYEPMPATFEFLRRNAEHNGERFRVVQRAIAGEAIGAIAMTASADAEASAVGASIAADLSGRGEVITVAADGIDDVLGELTSGAPVVIKLDLEGVERSVIEASRWIDDHDCLLLFEDHAKDPTCEVTEAVLAKEWPIYFFHDDGRLDRIESVAQAAALKTVANRGYNFFGLHPGGSFAPLCGENGRIMSTMQRTYSPVDGALLVERELAGNSARERLLDRSVAAQALWASTPLERRIEQLERMVDAFVAMRGEIAEEITSRWVAPSHRAHGGRRL